MPHAGFVHLRVHSAYSLSEGAITLKQLVALARDFGMPAVAVTDTGNLFGALEFSLAAADKGVQPIIGTLLALARPGGANGRGRVQTDSLVLLAQNETGYRNLVALTSKAFLETEAGDTPHVHWTDLEGRSDGLIALTGGPAGPVGALLLEGQRPAAEQVMDALSRLFPGRLYVELMRHGMEAEQRTEDAFLDMAFARDLPLVATNDVFFADRAMHEAHDVLLCIAEGAYIGQQNRRRVTPDHCLKSAEAMRALFAALPEAVDNTLVIARRCAFMVRPRKPILPAYPHLQGNTTEAEEMRRMARDGLDRRLAQTIWTEGMDEAAREAAAKPYRERLDYEMGVIETMGFAGYFLIVAEFIQWAKKNGIPVGPGRGSGAGSVVAWALTITDLDPLRFGLLFERFLNPERVSMPDFDVDFCQDGRDRVIEHVRDTYGHDRVAQIITFGKLQARAALRDVGRVLQMPYGQVDRICKLVPNNPANPISLAQALETVDQLREQQLADPSVGKLFDIAMKLEGLYRNASTHAAGVVIGDRPLAELVPLYRDPRSPMPVTQFNMKYVEQAGLVKFDFLGLKTLTVLRRAEELIGRRVPGFQLSRIPLDDPATFEMLGRGETTGVFQLESSGMRDVLRRLKPTRFEDVIALVALYRPGPMDDIPSYIKVKNGEQEPDYLHPSLKPILEETFGIMVYQEQVMQIAQVLSGFSLGGADLLRRAMGKKIKSEMEAQKRVFIDGAVARGVDPAQAGLIFEKVEKFAGYGFNKCHSAPYAMVAYQTAYLKANHPVEFLAASMTLDQGNTDKLNVFRQELVRLGIRLLPPDVNHSDADFSVEPLPDGGSAIRYALGAIKGVGGEAMRALVAERRQRGPFANPFDLARRLDVRVINKRQLENLIRAGALDGLLANRARLLAGVDLLTRYAHAAAEERASSQVSLFGDGGDAPPLVTPGLPEQAEWDTLEKLRQEFDAIGFYLSAHPLDAYEVRRLGCLGCAEVLRSASGRVKMAGIVVTRRERMSRADKRYAFVTLSDASGVYDVTLFAEVLATARALLEPGTPVLLTVEVQRSGEDVRLTALEIAGLDQAAARLPSNILVFLREAKALGPLRDTLERDGKGRGQVTVVVPVDAMREVEIALPGGFAVSPRGRAAVKAIAGVLDVREA